MKILGASVKEWSDATLAAQEVVFRRMLVLSRCDEEAQAELHRAFSEKLGFCARWSAILMTDRWKDLDGTIARMAREMRSDIVGNRERLSSASAQRDSAPPQKSFAAHEG